MGFMLGGLPVRRERLAEAGIGDTRLTVADSAPVGHPGKVDRAELAQFLGDRRARVRPADVRAGFAGV